MDKLFLLDAYALIYRAYYAFIKARVLTPRVSTLQPYWDLSIHWKRS